MKDNLESYWVTILFGVFLIGFSVVLTTNYRLRQKGVILTAFVGILFLLGGLLKPNRPRNKKNGTERTPVHSFPYKDKKDILLKRFEESFKEIRLIQDYNWKGITIVTTAVSALLGSTRLFEIKEFGFTLLFGFLAFIFILIGLFFLIRDREPFLEHLVILSRIESLLGLHAPNNQFPDKRLLPFHFEKGADITYEEYIKSNKWKIRSLFFGFLLLYTLLGCLVIFWLILSYLVPVSKG